MATEGQRLRQHGGLVGGCHHQNRPAHALRPQVLFHELHYFAAALAHQGDDVDVGFDVLGNHAHEGTLAHAGTGEDADSLALADGEHAVNDLDPELQPFPDGAGGPWD